MYTIVRLKFYFLTLIISIVILHSKQVLAQGLLKPSQSRSQAMRKSNPQIINSVGKIRGNEVKRSDVPRDNQNQPGEYEQYTVEVFVPDVISPDAVPTVMADPEDNIKEF